MKDFIAKFGYTLCWGLGTPKGDLETNYDGFYKFGLLVFIILGIFYVIAVILLIIEILKERSEVENND